MESEPLIKKLRTHRIAVTPQRLAVLTVLQNRRDHPTAQQIYQEVLRQLPMISFNTVYKTLEVLCQKGLAIKVNPLHEVAHYDGETQEHTHLICRVCHQIIDLDLKPSLLIPLPQEELKGFRVENQWLLLWGLCPRCQPQPMTQEE
jgi:Fur family peroxide stress response transcriptional regulator